MSGSVCFILLTWRLSRARLRVIERRTTMIAGRVLGTANLYRAEPEAQPPATTAIPASAENCHVLPSIVNGPEVWHYKDVIVCDVCERAWFVDCNPDHWYVGDYVFWHPISWYHFRLLREAATILETARNQREGGYFG
jgi:hypothetical protein